ncbi:MAG TPA: helix-turn-helix domain-containing protein [Dehalococcoidia bacterium]|nr:helix-turn-helix domain-containing protein [Dehalococcoidia bacterium]
MANRARVLDAAREVFAEQGVAAEVKDIADRAGVGVATVYRGFGSKNDLLQATVERASESVAELLTTAENANDPRDGLLQLVTGLLDYAESYGWLIQASLADAEIDRLRVQTRREENQGRAARIIERSIQCGAIPGCIPVEVLRLLLEGAVLALAIRTRKHTPHPPAHEIADGLFGLMTNSLQTGAVP